MAQVDSISLMKRAGRNIRIRRFVGWIGFLCFGVTTAFALDPQKRITQYSHQSWGGADGLDQVFSIAQTTDGYIWVGAANGLFRFDGFHFKKWEAGPKEPRLPGPAFQLLGAKDGSLWIASTGHMLRFERDQMTDFPLPGVPLGSIIYKLQEGRDGTLWSATSSGLFKFTRGQWQKVELPDNFKNPSVSALLIDRGDTVWAGVVDFDFSGIRYQPHPPHPLLFESKHSEPSGPSASLSTDSLEGGSAKSAGCPIVLNFLSR
jgi:ligand-binding sensor domain-containing protein